jgi:hypothetical protein
MVGQANEGVFFDNARVMATTLWSRLAAAAVVSCLVASFSVTVSVAAEVQVCGLEREDFVQIAFPKNGMNVRFGEGLIKWATPPGLVVLAPENSSDLRGTIESAFTRIVNDGIVKPFRSAFATYRSIEDAMEVVDRHGSNNIFVFFDPSPYEGSVSIEFRLLMQRILRIPAVADQMIRNARGEADYSLNNLVDLRSGEVFATAALMRPQLESARIVLLIYMIYYANLSPNSREGTDFFERVFSISEEHEVKLTEFGRDYFELLVGDDVRFGMDKSAFVECRSR